MPYRVATFYFYTGTGNSYRVASWMADAVQEAGAETRLCAIEAASPPDAAGSGEDGLLGLVMPTHGFTAPWSMLRFALRLPRRPGAHAVVLATRGSVRLGSVYLPGFEGSATLLVAAILALKGYRVRGMVGVDMPSNWMSLHPALPPDAVATILARAGERVAGFAAAILSGQRRFVSAPIFALGLLLLPLSLAYLLMGRLFLSKLFFASDRCNGCGLCAAHCPNGAIEMRGPPGEQRPYWTFRCESCMRCMGFCPQQAVEVSHLLAVGVYLLSTLLPTAAMLVWMGQRIPALTFLRRVPRWLIEGTNALAMLALISPVFPALLRIRWVNWLFTHASLTHYYRRYHEPGTQLRHLRR